MHLTTQLQTLHLANTFTIARSSVDTEEVVVVRLEHGGITAFGEGAPVSYWGSPQLILRWRSTPTARG